jgi:ABC-type phosphate transport system substrate-binding protein
MTFLSLRRLIPACLVVAAAAVALAAPGTASASDLTEQCSGENIKANGSSFQAPILKIWQVDFNAIAGVPNKNVLACGGTQGDQKEPKVEYVSGGSGACLHGWGAESTEAVKYEEYPFCGTDEAPNATQKAEIESHKKGGFGTSLEEIPVLQGAVAIIVHLPGGCLAQSEVEQSGVKYKLGRLVLDDTSIEGVYAGTIKTWKELLANQTAEGGAGSDKLTCKGGTYNKVKRTAEEEENERIVPVVRLDHSGTTHIFKSFLLQVNTEPKLMEEYPVEVGGKATGCGKTLPEESEPWSAVSEACQNQRWPKAAEIVRGTESGNPGVVKRVNEVESSIGYADLAVVRELHYFSAKCTVHPGECGGENTKGTETKVGVQETKFWAEVQDSETPEATGFADPASNGDIEAAANSNCSGTVFTNKTGEKFPPATTRESWSGAKAEIVQARYSLCGLTYDLALTQYKYYVNTPLMKMEAQTVKDFLLWAVNTKAEGGGVLEKNTDYEKLSSTIIKKSETGIKEIGFEKV